MNSFNLIVVFAPYMMPALDVLCMSKSSSLKAVYLHLSQRHPAAHCLASTQGPLVSAKTGEQNLAKKLWQKQIAEDPSFRSMELLYGYHMEEAKENTESKHGGKYHLCKKDDNR